MAFLADDTLYHEVFEPHPNILLPSEGSGNIGQRAPPTYDEPVVSSAWFPAFRSDPSFAMTSVHSIGSDNPNISSNLCSTENTSQWQPVAQNSNHLIGYPAQQGYTDKTFLGGPSMLR